MGRSGKGFKPLFVRLNEYYTTDSMNYRSEGYVTIRGLRYLKIRRISDNKCNLVSEGQEKPLCKNWYAEIGKFDDCDVAIVKRNNTHKVSREYNIIDVNGNEILDGCLYRIDGFRFGFSIVEVGRDQFNYIDPKGNFLLDSPVDLAHDFDKHGKAVIGYRKRGNSLFCEYTVIDRKGCELFNGRYSGIKPQYDVNGNSIGYIVCRFDTLAEVEFNYIDTFGRILFDRYFSKIIVRNNNTYKSEPFLHLVYGGSSWISDIHGNVLNDEGFECAPRFFAYESRFVVNFRNKHKDVMFNCYCEPLCEYAEIDVSHFNDEYMNIIGCDDKGMMRFLDVDGDEIPGGPYKYINTIGQMVFLSNEDYYGGVWFDCNGKRYNYDYNEDKVIGIVDESVNESDGGGFAKLGNFTLFKDEDGMFDIIDDDGKSILGGRLISSVKKLYSGTYILRAKNNEGYNMFRPESGLLFDEWYSGITTSNDGYMTSIYVSKRFDKGVKMALVNDLGKFITKRWYDTIGGIAGDTIHRIVVLNNKRNIINIDGNELCHKWYDNIFLDTGLFRNGFARVENGGKYNFIDLDGHELCDEWYDEIRDFDNGFAVVARKDRNGNGMKYSMIDSNGIRITDKWFDAMKSMEGDFAFVYRNFTEPGSGTSKFLINYMDKYGHLLLDEWVDSAGAFKNGCAIIMRHVNTQDEDGVPMSNVIDGVGNKLFDEPFMYIRSNDENLTFECTMHDRRIVTYDQFGEMIGKIRRPLRPLQNG